MTTHRGTDKLRAEEGLGFCFMELSTASSLWGGAWRLSSCLLHSVCLLWAAMQAGLCRKHEGSERGWRE